MDAVSVINSNLNVLKILEHYDFDNINHHGDMIRAKCKIHGGVNDTTFIINEHTGLWYCHAGICGGGDIFHLVAKFEKCPFPQAVTKVAEILGINIDTLEIAQESTKHIKEIQKWVKTMQKWNSKSDMQEYVIDAEIRPVTKFRSFELETLEHFELGFVDEVVSEAYA